MDVAISNHMLSKYPIIWLARGWRLATARESGRLMRKEGNSADCSLGSKYEATESSEDLLYIHYYLLPYGVDIREKAQASRMAREMVFDH